MIESEMQRLHGFDVVYGKYNRNRVNAQRALLAGTIPKEYTGWGADMLLGTTIRIFPDKAGEERIEST